MTNREDRIARLLNKQEDLLERQERLAKDINNLRSQINELQRLKNEEETENVIFQNPEEDRGQMHDVVTNALDLKNGDSGKSNKIHGVKNNIEKFIGENLISKIGIAITVIGIAIGTKYSIDHNLITPLTRIILGYIAGLVLLSFGFGLRKAYENYSAVLVSGGIAVLYFTTYVGHGLFDLIPQTMTFLLMMVFTIFAVVIALDYNKQIIAHIGLVGAYAIPFLLNDGSGKIFLLFGYISIINLGILAISFIRYWKPLFYSSFCLSWAIFSLWFISEYSLDDHFGVALTYLTILFVIFYITFLAYKLVKKERFGFENVVLLLTNSFVFFGLGYTILGGHGIGGQILGLFTIFNGIVHAVVAIIIYRQKIVDRNLFQMVLGIALIFMTIAIPVQLDGNWVTLLWAGEAALLFWIGRRKGSVIYEKISWPLMFLTFFSLLHDWVNVYGRFGYEQAEANIPLLNVTFLSSLLVIISFGFINYINKNKRGSLPLSSFWGPSRLMSFSIAVMFLLVLYFSFRLEIANYWNQLYEESIIAPHLDDVQSSGRYGNDDLMKFKTIWITVYSLFFFTTMSFFNIKKLKIQWLGLYNLGINFLIIAVFLPQGLYVLGELRDSNMEQSHSQYYQIKSYDFSIRYVVFFFVALMLVVCKKYVMQDFMKWNFKIPVDLLIHLTILWILSNELMNRMDIMELGQLHTFGLSIFWGVYSLTLIVLGIWKRQKHLRIAAIFLFTIILIKLFVYDMSGFGTLYKTIAFVSLGVLLLITSFLYNKYKSHLYNE